MALQMLFHLYCYPALLHFFSKTESLNKQFYYIHFSDLITAFNQIEHTFLSLYVLFCCGLYSYKSSDIIQSPEALRGLSQAKQGSLDA